VVVVVVIVGKRRPDAVVMRPDELRSAKVKVPKVHVADVGRRLDVRVVRRPVAAAAVHVVEPVLDAHGHERHRHRRRARHLARVRAHLARLERQRHFTTSTLADPPSSLDHNTQLFSLFNFGQTSRILFSSP
jgi:hypothetical protein